MAAPRTRPATRRLLLWFMVVTMLPTTALLWLGWTVVEQGLNDERDRAAERLASRLRDTLAAMSDDFDRVVASSGAVEPQTAEATVLAFDDAGLRLRAGVKLPYYPAAPLRSAAADDDFVRASRLEFREADLPAAIGELTGLSASRSADVRAEALLRLARVFARSGELDRALQTLDALERLDPAVAGGLPAGLAAGRSRIVLLTPTRPEQAAQAGRRLASDLASGRWALTHAEYEAARQLAESLLPAAPTGVGDPDALALAEAADRAWSAWRNRGPLDVPSSSLAMVRTNGGLVLVRTNISADGAALLLVGPRALQAMWREATEGPGSASFDFALTEAGERVFLGVVGDPGGRQTVLDPATTKLPWTVHAASRQGLALALLPGRAQLMLAGVGIMILVVLFSGYVLNRAISREIAVAQLQSEFVSAVSHEFRTPLTTIRQLSELLAGGRVSTAGRQQQFYDTLVAESERLRRMVEGLLDFGRMTSGRLEYRFGPVDVPALVSEVAASVMRDHPGARIDVTTSGPAAPVPGDRDALARVFGNVLENAVKYSPAEHRAWVAIGQDEDRIVVEVRDRGLGIAPEEQRGIFEQFVRGTTASAAGIPGTGIGLAMASQIVAAHGGTIVVDSEPGRGSTFTVQLPAAPSVPEVPEVPV